MTLLVRHLRSSTTIIIDVDSWSLAFSPCANDSGQDCVQLSTQHSDSEGLTEDNNAGEDDIDVIDACPALKRIKNYLRSTDKLVNLAVLSVE